MINVSGTMVRFLGKVIGTNLFFSNICLLDGKYSIYYLENVFIVCELCDIILMMVKSDM
jgi:hypothetical protein